MDAPSEQPAIAMCHDSECNTCSMYVCVRMLFILLVNRKNEGLLSLVSVWTEGFGVEDRRADQLA